MLVGAGFNPHFFSKRNRIPLPDQLSLIEVGLRELNLISAAPVPLSLHMARSPIAENPQHHAAFIQNIQKYIKGRKIHSIGLHLMGQRNEGIGQLGFTSQFSANPQIVARSVDFINRLKDTLSLPVWVENANFYTEHAEEIKRNWDGVHTILEQTDARLILDISHLVIEANNLRQPPAAALGLIPWGRVVEIHLSGYKKSHDGSYHDAHNIPVAEECWALLETCSHMGFLLPDTVVTIEHTDPQWYQKKTEFEADFNRLNKFLSALDNKVASSDASDRAMQYAQNYLGKVIAGYVDDIRDACKEAGSTYEHEIQDWLIQRIFKHNYRLTLSEEELYEDNGKAFFAPVDFIKFLQEKYPS